MKINFGKIKKWLSLLLLSIYSLCSFSCNDLFSKDLHSDLLNGFTTEFHFYSDKEDSGQEIKKTTKRFEIGSTITLDDLPNYTDSEIKNWKDKKRLSSWKIYRKTGSTEIIDQDITNLFVENVELDLYAIWDTQYKIIYKFQNADLTAYDEREEHIAYGRAETSVSVTSSVNIPEGYELISSSPVDLTINDDGSSSVEFTFDRITVSLTFDPNGGSFPVDFISNPFTGTYGAHFDASVIPEPSKDGHRFLRWDPELPSTFPSTDATYTAVYGGEECNISYADWKGGQYDAKAFSGDESTLPSTYICGQECVIPVPVVSSSNTESSAEFEGWYTDAGCSVDNRLGINSSGDYVIPDTSTGDITLYAKWKYNWIYVDPQSDSAFDTNTGIGKNCPVKTIAEARQYIKHGGCQILAMSTISNPSDRTNLVNITGDYNCILKKVNTDPNEPLIEVDVFGDWCFNNLSIEDSISTYVIKVKQGNLVVNGLTFNDGSDNKLPIYLSSGTTTKIENADSISGIPAFARDVYIKIYSPDYQSFPQVLSAADGVSISSYYIQFESMHEGFEINEEGRLVTSSSIEINPGYPSVTKISLGELESAVAYVVGSKNILTFKVSDQAYDAIKEESDGKKIKWTLSGEPFTNGESQITGNAGSYKAELDVTALPIGMHSITITAESATEDVVLESIESVISVVK